MSLFTVCMGAALCVISLFAPGTKGDVLMYFALLLVGMGNIGMGIELAIKAARK